jgi:hypothetical protein
VALAQEFGVSVDDKLKIRQLAAEKLISHLEIEDGS